MHGRAGAAATRGGVPRRWFAAALLALCSVLTFFTFYNLPFLLFANSGGGGAMRGGLLSGLFGAGTLTPNVGSGGIDPVAEERRREAIRAQVQDAAEAAKASWRSKRTKTARGKSKSGSLDLPSRCMTTTDCKRACRKACFARATCAGGEECKRGREARLEQHAQTRCNEHTHRCDSQCQEESKGIADGGKSDKRALEMCKWRCTLSAGSPCLAPIFSSCPQCSGVQCVRGRCQCSVLYRAPDNSKCLPSLPLSTKLAPQLGLCFAPFSSARFALDTRGEPTFLDLQHNRTVHALLNFAQNMGALSGPAQPTDQLDLPNAADFATCAVVGSSDTLVGSGLGAEIDSHSAVFRFNDAPTRGFTQDVGSRTTVRIQNSMTCGWHEYAGEMCIHYTSGPGSECKNELLPWWRDCGFVRLSHRMLEYVKMYFYEDSVPKKDQRDTSAGFFGTVLALHLCGRVDIYGFTQRSGHYFEKLDRSKGKVSFGEKHAWELERACSTAYQALPDVSKAES